MIRLRHKLLIDALRILDQLLLIAVLLFLVWATTVRHEIGGVRALLERHYRGSDSVGSALLVLGWFAIFNSTVRYNANRFTPWASQMRDLFRATTLAAFLLILISVIFWYEQVRPLVVVSFWAVVLAITGASRLIIIWLLRVFRKSGINQRLVLFAGCNPTASELAGRIESNPELGYRIIGFVSEGTAEKTASADTKRWPIKGTIHEMKAILEKEPVDEVIICLPGREYFGEIYDIISLGKDLGVVVRLLPVGVDMNIIFQSHVESYNGQYVITFFRTGHLWQLLVKRLMDIAISFVMLVILSPLLFTVALIIRLSSPGPALFVQERMGMNKRTFRLYKFRSMVVDAESKKKALQHLNEMDGPVFKIKNDPRITPIGRFIRKTSIDELPQLMNVLFGDMSLVGPRPPLPTEVAQYEWVNRKRLSIRPGLTCLWQIGGRNNVSFDEWMQLDRDYIENWSLWLDCKILLKTIPVVLFGRGAA